MQKAKLVFGILTIFLFFGGFAAYGQEARLATFHETAQVIIDERFQHQSSSSISIISTSAQEIRVPIDLDQMIHNATNVVAVIITNEDQCVLGVQDSTCVMINISREGFEGGINEAQSKGREIGDSLITDINKAFNLDTKFHSVFIHVDDKINKELETSGVVSGKGIVSAVYTMTKQDTSYLFEGLSTILIPSQIRNSGGFLDVAKKISDDPSSSMTFSIIPQGSSSLYQLQVSIDKPLEPNLAIINPLEFFEIEKLQRSDYFSSGFFPLNSIVQVVVLSNQTMKVAGHTSELIPILEKDGEKYPSDLTRNGWLFDPDSGDQIVGKYLFGKTTEVSKNDLVFNVGGLAQSTPTNDDSIYVLIGVGIAAAIAIFWYLRKPKTKSEK